MKKLLLFFCISLFCTSCKLLSKYEWSWSIVNKTEQTLKIKYLYFPTDNVMFEYQVREINPNGFIEIYRAETSVRKQVYFDYYVERSAGSYGEDAYWQILSEDDVVLKTWNYSDMGLPGQRFFEESSWHYDRMGGEWFTMAINAWTFDILPEDIQQVDQ